jgi:hypothetical protein
MESANPEPVTRDTQAVPLLCERMPGKSFGEYWAIAAIVGLIINGFVLAATFDNLTKGDLGLPITLHAVACTGVALLFLWGWKSNSQEQILVVLPDVLEFSHGGKNQRVPRQGAEIRMSYIRGPHGDSNRVVVIGKTAQFSLPEELTGSPDSFCNLLESHGWRVVRPVGWGGRLY